jgi:hypothetical protein
MKQLETPLANCNIFHSTEGIANMVTKQDQSLQLHQHVLLYREEPFIKQAICNYCLIDLCTTVAIKQSYTIYNLHPSSTRFNGQQR